MKRACIVAYDIQCERRRAQARRVLMRLQLSAQYSVFECELELHVAEELLLQMAQIIDLATDKLMLAWVDRRERNLRVGAALGGHCSDSPLRIL